MNVLEKISAVKENFTFQEMRIFTLLTDDVKKFALSSIGEIAEKLDISKTTLVRFSKSCGFKGYADLRKQLQREAFFTGSPAKKMQDMIKKNYNLNMEDLCKREQANIQESFNSFDAHALDYAVSLIREARDIHTLSWGVSGHLAEMFATRTRLLGMRCSMIKRHLGTLLEEAAHLGKGDVIVLFEFPPYAQEVLETVKELAARKVKIILVTDSKNCPETAYSEVTFYCATDTLFFGNSFVAPLFWVNLITSLVMNSNRDIALTALEKQQAFFNGKQYYHPKKRI